MRLYRRVKCLRRRHESQAKRDAQALLRAAGGGGYKNAAAKRGAEAPAPAEEEPGLGGRLVRKVCWCLDEDCWEEAQ
jgi:hypothetical protein